MSTTLGPAPKAEMKGAIIQTHENIILFTCRKKDYSILRFEINCRILR
jgi:hypothetical protein